MINNDYNNDFGINQNLPTGKTEKFKTARHRGTGTKPANGNLLIANIWQITLHVFGADESHWMGSADFLISDFPSHLMGQPAAATLESSVVIRLLKNHSPACLPISE